MMHGGASAVLRQIGRTGIVVLALGGLVYLGMNRLAGIDGAQFWGAIVLAVPIALYGLVHVAGGIRSGMLPYGKTAVIHSAEPTLFWCLVLFESGMAGLLTWLGIWAVAQLL